MRHLAAYLLLLIGGKAPTEEHITNLLASVGIDVDAERLSLLLAELAEKDVEELVALGKEKLMKGGIAAAAAAAPAGAAAGGAAAAEAPKEEKPKVEEVDALDGGMDMFGGGGAGGGDY
eukprot:gene11120-12388_t